MPHHPHRLQRNNQGCLGTWASRREVAHPDTRTHAQTITMVNIFIIMFLSQNSLFHNLIFQVLLGWATRARKRCRPQLLWQLWPISERQTNRKIVSTHPQPLPHLVQRIALVSKRALEVGHLGRALIEHLQRQRIVLKCFSIIEFYANWSPI